METAALAFSVTVLTLAVVYLAIYKLPRSQNRRDILFFILLVGGVDFCLLFFLFLRP